MLKRRTMVSHGITTKEENFGLAPSPDKITVAKVPLYDVRQMTDDEWNRLAYRNYLERRQKNEAKATHQHKGHSGKAG